MITSKEELLRELRKTKASVLDELIEYKISEAVLRSLIEGAEKEENYYLGIVQKRESEIKELKKEVTKWKGQYNAKLKRDDKEVKYEEVQKSETLQEVQ